MFKDLSQNRRGLAHLAESAEQNVPVPLSADDFGIGPKQIALAILALVSVAAPVHAVFQDGVDVSVHQGTINWSNVKSAGIKFAFTKATEGIDFIDSRFTANMSGARTAGVLIGPYHYARPDSYTTDPNDAVNEANDFVDAILPYYQGTNLTLRAVVDVEESDVGVSNPKTFISNWVVNFENQVHSRLGFYPIVYASSSYASTYFNNSVTQSDFWVANWRSSTSNPPSAANVVPWTTWRFWQWTSTGSVAGISGNVDRDVFDGTMLQLTQYIPDYHAGDFDGNLIVDARDYALWRNTQGTSVNPGIGADADLSGVVDTTDFNIWRANFGKTYSAGAGSVIGSFAVPEPATGILLAAALSTWATFASNRRRRG